MFVHRWEDEKRRRISWEFSGCGGDEPKNGCSGRSGKGAAWINEARKMEENLIYLVTTDLRTLDEYGFV